ncbi:hypothetical protein AAEX63_09810 [Luteococcus sp. H138]|uniref:hypothetical protein n=1 Tax=unclassified Luteococcus TaxID=2639923 RepID=UPI00313E1F8C
MEALLMRLFPRTSAGRLGFISALALLATVFPLALWSDQMDTPRMSLPVWLAWVFGTAFLVGWVIGRIRQIRLAQSLPFASDDDDVDARSRYFGVVTLPVIFVIALLVSIF